MSRYSIKDLEQITGVKAHTIRIWERRYGLIIPRRTTTNIRYYSDDDLKRLLNVAMLNASGIKISKLAKLENSELQTRVLEVSRKRDVLGNQIDQLVLAMVNFDQNLFEQVLARAILHNGMEKTVSDLLFPFFERIGILWQVGSINPAQEHFISNLIRQKLIVAIDSLPQPSPSKGLKFIFFLREDELHEISLLFYAYLAKKLGHQTLYLGQNVPFKDLIKASQVFQPDGLFSAFITSFSKGNLSSYLNELKKQFGGSKILITGLQLQNESSIPPGLVVIESPQSFKEWLEGEKS